MGKKYIKLFFIVPFLILILSACGNNGNVNQNSNYNELNSLSEEASKIQEKEENPYNITTEYDGVYCFKEYSGGYNDPIHTTIGTFLFDNGNFTLNYYLNDHYDKIYTASGVFGLDNDGSLKLKYTSGVIWNISINDTQLSYNGRLSALRPIGDNVELIYVGDKSTFSQALSKIKQEVANDELYFSDNIRWLMSNEEVNQVIGTTSPISSGSITYAKKSHSTYNNPYYIKETVYVLEKKQLKAYFININDSGLTYSNYEKIKKVLVSKYGEPNIENFNWIDETYKENKNKWDDAFKYSDFSIKTIWNSNDNFSIVIKWDYDGSCAVSYCQKGYENQL